VNSSLAKLSSSYEGKMASVERAMDAYGSELRTEMKDIRDKAGLSSQAEARNWSETAQQTKDISVSMFPAGNRTFAKVNASLIFTLR